MFPVNQYKETVTVFTPLKDGGGRIRYLRRVLRRCFWSDGVSQKSGGSAVERNVKLHIPLRFNLGYIKHDDKLDAADGGWSIRLGGDFERSLVFRGDAEYPALEQWQSRADTESALNAFREELASGFGGLVSAIREYTPEDIEELTFGPNEMHRVVAEMV